MATPRTPKPYVYVFQLGHGARVGKKRVPTAFTTAPCYYFRAEHEAFGEKLQAIPEPDVAEAETDLTFEAIDAFVERWELRPELYSDLEIEADEEHTEDRGFHAGATYDQARQALAAGGFVVCRTVDPLAVPRIVLSPAETVDRALEDLERHLDLTSLALILGRLGEDDELPRHASLAESVVVELCGGHQAQAFSARVRAAAPRWPAELRDTLVLLAGHALQDEETPALRAFFDGLPAAEDAAVKQHLADWDLAPGASAAPTKAAKPAAPASPAKAAKPAAAPTKAAAPAAPAAPTKAEALGGSAPPKKATKVAAPPAPAKAEALGGSAPPKKATKVAAPPAPAKPGALGGSAPPKKATTVAAPATAARPAAPTKPAAPAKPAKGADAFAARIAAIEAAAASAGVRLPPGASDAQIAAAEAKLGVKLPAEVRAFYRAHDGGPNNEQVCSNRELLSLAGMVHQWEMYKEAFDEGELDEEDAEPDEGVQREWWIPAWIPVSYELGGNHDVLDLAPDEGGTVGQIVAVWHDDSARTVEGTSFLSWLEEQTWGAPE
jgi:cell wall assembly regulator SMI1